MSSKDREGERLGGSSGPHPFVEPADNRLGMALTAQHSPDLAMTRAGDPTDANVRNARCAMGGCGRTRQDPIHMPADE